MDTAIHAVPSHPQTLFEHHFCITSLSLVDGRVRNGLCEPQTWPKEGRHRHKKWVSLHQSQTVAIPTG